MSKTPLKLTHHRAHSFSFSGSKSLHFTLFNPQTMTIISIHLRSSHKPDSAPVPHPHTRLHPVRATSQQCGQEANKQRCWVSSAGSMLYCLIINCNFMLNYPSHEGRFPISSTSLSWSGHSMCKPAGCSTHQNAHDAQVH